MAEFQEVMKQWARMCNAVPGKAEHINLCSDKESGYVCPLHENGLCNFSIGKQSIEDWKEGEHIIMAWAAEHPEPVYPTWWEWLFSIGAVTRKVKPDVAATLIDTGLLDHIPADMAEKLGIKPKGES